jgi:hypothetical protein
MSGGKRDSRNWQMLRKIFTFLTLGNFWYEEGDMLWGSVEFIHCFSSIKEICCEFEAAGLNVVHVRIPEQSRRGGAVLRRDAPSTPNQKEVRWDTVSEKEIEKHTESFAYSDCPS